VDVVKRFAPTLEQFRREGLLTWDAHSVSLTELGLPRVDRMIRALYLPAHDD
jgi:hypothetical protein